MKDKSAFHYTLHTLPFTPVLLELLRALLACGWIDVSLGAPIIRLGAIGFRSAVCLNHCAVPFHIRSGFGRSLCVEGCGAEAGDKESHG